LNNKESYEETQMMECDFHQQNSQNNHHRNEDDEEDQFQGEHQGVRCQTQ
jgi:hypothetical protein